jgi:hypothetical protein
LLKIKLFNLYVFSQGLRKDLISGSHPWDQFLCVMPVSLGTVSNLLRTFQNFTKTNKNDSNGINCSLGSLVKELKSLHNFKCFRWNCNFADIIHLQVRSSSTLPPMFQLQSVAGSTNASSLVHKQVNI